MNRRTFGKTIVSAIAGLTAGKIFGKIVAADISEKHIALVETFERYPKAGYKTRWLFDSEDEAIDFVQHLMPELVQVRVRQREGDYAPVLAGYRGAIRAIIRDADQIVGTTFVLINSKTNETVLPRPDGIFFFNAQFAWSYISQMRVNGKPVELMTGNLPSEWAARFRRSKTMQIEYF